MKATIAVITVSLLLLSCSLSLVLAAKGDLIGHNGLVAAHKPYIVSPQNNRVYSSDSLMLNVSFKAMAYANMNYSATYSLDGQAKEPFPVVKHYLGNWVIYHGENDYVDGSVKLPAISDGSHTLTSFLTLDWEIGYQNGTSVYTYFDSETVNFSIGQAKEPEQSAAEQPIVEPFGYDELSGSIFVTAPVGNFSYSESDIVVNASLHIGGHEYEPNTHYVPYQNISCLYSLDESEWQNMTLVSATKSELFPSIPNNFWYSNMWLNYTATLHGVSGGSHYLRIGVVPDSIPIGYDSSQGSIVYFNVVDNGADSRPSTSELGSAQILTGVFVFGTVAAVVAVAAVVYVKKRRAAGAGGVKNP